jgi:CheY-like chemotaxis protein
MGSDGLILSPALLAGRDVLLVEDEIVIAFMVEDMLMDLGCPLVLHAGTVSEALAILDSQRPQLAVLDVNLGDGTAYPVAERLNDLAIPFIFATGYGLRGLDPRWSGTTVLQKPFDSRVLAAALRTALG